MGDITYGACCVDDFTSNALDCDFLIHYGHSCLIPINITNLSRILYIFVQIEINNEQMIESIKHNFDSNQRVIIAGTIQFSTAIQECAVQLKEYFIKLYVPQAKPLSPAEVLGCTSPKLDENEFDLLIFISDGRFHLESIMICNPNIPAIRYNPYDRRITREEYDSQLMNKIRFDTLSYVQKLGTDGIRWGLILSTLGRQGSPNILKRLEVMMNERNIEYDVILLSEIFNDKLMKFMDISVWVQIGCPRLSIDWGAGFSVPLLNAYEACVALGKIKWNHVQYPMDYYRSDGGIWSNYYMTEDERLLKVKEKKERRRQRKLMRGAVKKRQKVIVEYD